MSHKQYFAAACLRARACARGKNGFFTVCERGKRAAGQTVRRTVSAGGARRPRRSRGGLRPGLAACRGRRGRLPQGPAGAAAAGDGGGARQAGERESRRAVPPDGAAARNGLLRRKWQDWKVKGMFTSLYGKNVLQYIIGKLPEKITPPRAGSKEHRL